MVLIVIRVKVIYFGIFCIVTVYIGGPLEKRFLPKGNPPKINQIKSNQIKIFLPRFLYHFLKGTAFHFDRTPLFLLDQFLFVFCLAMYNRSL